MRSLNQECARPRTRAIKECAPWRTRAIRECRQLSTRTFAALGIVLSTISPIGENTPPVTLTAKFAVSSDWLSINAPPVTRTPNLGVRSDWLRISAPQGDTPPVPTPAPMGDANTTAPIVPPEAAGGVVDVPADDPTTMYAPGPTAIIVRACVDTNTDRRCTLGEGVAGLPVAVLDATRRCTRHG